MDTVRTSLIEKLYESGRYTCYSLSPYITAWTDESWWGKRLIMAWGVSKDAEGMYAAEQGKGVVLAEKEMAELKQHFESGVFARKLMRAKDIKDGNIKMKLRGSLFRPTTLSIVNIPVYGVMITFSQGKRFCKIGMRKLIGIAEHCGISFNEGDDEESAQAELEYDNHK